MNTMAAALLKAQMITDDDVRLAEKREKEERERLEAKRLKEHEERHRLTLTLSSFDSRVIFEIRDFMDDHPDFLSLDILETMAARSEGKTIEETRRNSNREWSKILAAFNEAQRAMAAT